MASALQQQYNDIRKQAAVLQRKYDKNETIKNEAQRRAWEAHSNGETALEKFYLEQADIYLAKRDALEKEKGELWRKQLKLESTIQKEEGKSYNDVYDAGTAAIDSAYGDTLSKYANKDADYNDAVDLMNQAVSGMTAKEQAIPGAVDIEADVTKLLTEELADPTGALADKIGDKVKSAKDMASDAASSATDLAAGLFGGKEDPAVKLSTAPSKDQGPRNPQTTIATLDPNSSEAIKHPVTFKVGDIGGDKLTTTTTSAPAGADDASPEGMLAKMAEELEKETGTSLPTVKDAIGGVTGDLSKKLSNATSALKASVGAARLNTKSLLEPATSTLTDLNKNISGALSGMTASLGSAVPNLGTSLPGLGNMTSGITGAISGLADALPTKLAGKLSGLTTDALSQIAGDKLTSALNSATDVISKLGGIASGAGIMSTLAGLMKMNKSTYNTIADTTGLDVSHLFGNNSNDTVNTIYTVANGICSGVRKVDTVDFSLNKDLYDVLLSVAAKYGMSDLITQLKNCAGGEQAYFDDRSVQALASLASDVAGTGDINTYAAVQDAVGSRNIPNQEDTLRVLGANMATGGKIDPVNKGKYIEVLGKANTSVEKVLSTPIGMALSLPDADGEEEEGEEEEVDLNESLGDTPDPTPAASTVTTNRVLDAKYVAFMCAKGNFDIVEEVMTHDTAIAVCMAYKLYGGYA